MARRQAVCLANSRKGVGGYCVAAFDPDSDEWIRPIGTGWEGAVTAPEQRLSDGTLAEPLDVIEFSVGGLLGQPGQPENRQLRGGQWKRVDRLSPSDARQLLERLSADGPLLGTRGKEVSPDEMANLDRSLEIVQPTDLTLSKDGRGGLRGQFFHGDEYFDLSVSDPAWKAALADSPPGEYQVEGDPFLTISVTVEPFHGAHWKLIAAIITV